MPPHSPRAVCRSEWQTPQNRMSMATSPGPGSRRSKRERRERGVGGSGGVAEGLGHDGKEKPSRGDASGCDEAGGVTGLPAGCGSAPALAAAKPAFAPAPLAGRLSRGRAAGTSSPALKPIPSRQRSASNRGSEKCDARRPLKAVFDHPARQEEPPASTPKRRLTQTPPSRFSTRTAPTCNFMIAATIARPRPELPELPESRACESPAR